VSLLEWLTEREPVRNEHIPFTILDLCAGTGCIGLSLLKNLTRIFPEIRVTAVDLNASARTLCHRTILLNQQLGRLPPNLSRFEYCIHDIRYLDLEQNRNTSETDIVVANPPYISVPAFSRDTSRSARCFEPREALVPTAKDEAQYPQGESSGDLFYKDIIRIAAKRKAKIIVMEVADLEQAERVLELARELEKKYGQTYCTKQIWCDDITTDIRQMTDNHSSMSDYSVIGSGNARAVVLARSWGSVCIEKHDI
jgi:methylase of polypeptide subunit release factors